MARPRKRGHVDYCIEKLGTASETAASLRTSANSYLSGNSFRALRFRVCMLYMRMIVRMLFCRLRIRTFRFHLLGAGLLRRRDLAAAVHARRLIETMRETEITAFFVLHGFDALEGVVRPAITGVAASMAHAY